MPNITVSLPADLYLEVSKLKNKSAIVTAALRKHIHPIITQKEYYSPEYCKAQGIKRNLKRGSTDTFEAELAKQVKAQSDRIAKLMNDQEQERIQREDIRSKLESEAKREIKEELMAKINAI